MIRVQREDFDPGVEQQNLARFRADIGAIVAFTGTVRDLDDGEPIESMTLEHYPGMTERELLRIEAEARRRFDLADCLIIHRYGELRAGERVNRIIGVLSPVDEPYWLGAKRLKTQMLDDLELIWPDTRPEWSYVPNEVRPEAVTDAGRIVSAKGRLFRVLEGGRKDH
jgi:molybdopterin synthase catalytic subunit